DPGRYREDTESSDWEDRDPLIRIRNLLERQGAWTPSWEEELEERASQTIENAVEWAESIPEPTLDEMLDRMYAGSPHEGGRPPFDPTTGQVSGGPAGSRGGGSDE